VTTLGGITKGVGASYSWTSENSGDGSISYAEVVANQLIESKLYFGSPEDEPAQGLMIFSEVADGVKVTWEIHMDMGNNPVMRIMGRYMDEMVGSTFENGLIAMKKITENEKPIITVNELDIESVPFISVLDSCSINEMSQKISLNYSILGSYIGSNQIKSGSFPRTSFHTWNPPTKVSFEQMLILSEVHESQDDVIQSGMTYSGKVITATHVGSYETSSVIWEALDEYMTSNGMEMNGSPWEEYENSPRNQPDPSQLITNIYMPVK
jgi:effector-binding domain-containing protein